jgi:hypothetical protein
MRLDFAAGNLVQQTSATYKQWQATQTTEAIVECFCLSWFGQDTLTASGRNPSRRVRAL